VPAVVVVVFFTAFYTAAFFAVAFAFAAFAALAFAKFATGFACYCAWNPSAI
jgi:hypothetical protein